jgi:hypothetical protein
MYHRIYLALIHAYCAAPYRFGIDPEALEHLFHSGGSFARSRKIIAIYFICKVNRFHCADFLLPFEAGGIKLPTGKIHPAIRGHQNYAPGFGKFDYLRLRLFAADKYDAFDIHHVRCPYDLGIYKPGEQDRLIFYKGKHIAHKVGAARGIHLRIETFLSAMQFGIKNLATFPIFINIPPNMHAAGSSQKVGACTSVSRLGFII